MIVPEVSELEMAFGTTKDLPDWNNIPKEFQNLSSDIKWCALASRLFYKGSEGIELKFKDGIDGNKVMRWYRAHAASWEPKHEHKMGGIAFMFSQWMDDWSEKKV